MRSRCPTRDGTIQAAFTRLVEERAVSVVVEEYVVQRWVRNRSTFPCYPIARTDTLPPSGVPDARLLRHVLIAERAAVLIEVRHERRRQTVSLDKKEFRQAVVIVVEDGHPGTGSLSTEV
jgi:hypothetical protein